MNHSLKQAVKNHYDNAQLSTEQLQLLQNLQSQLNQDLRQDSNENQEAETLVKLLKRLFYFPVPLGSSVLGILLIVILTATVFVIPKLTESSFDRQVTEEIAYNHNKRSKLEVVSSSLGEVNKYLSRLDFTPIQSVKMPSANWELLGGRYCSIQGVTAAQLRLREKNSHKIYTLYQTPIPDSFRGGGVNASHLEDNVRVTLWAEDGLLMGLAVDAGE